MMDDCFPRSIPIGRRLFKESGASIGVTLSELHSPWLFSILAAAGADYGFVDLEHTSYSHRDVAVLLAGARAAHLPAVVRPPDLSRSSIGRTLDLGADGILAPRICSQADAEAAVRYAKYKPLGDRGASFGGVRDGFRRGNHRASIEAANAQTILVAVVETAEALEHIDTICETAGIDAVWIGPSDLSVSLGVPGDFESTTYRQAESVLVEACRRREMPFAIGAAGTPAQAVAQIRQGCFTVLVGDDATLLQRAIAGLLRDIHAGLGGETPDRG